MKRSFIGLFLATVGALSVGVTVQCEAGDFCTPRFLSPPLQPYVTQQRVRPVVRNVQVTVPISQPPRPCSPPVCLPPSIYCPPSRSATTPPPPLPVRVYIAVRPEECDQRCPVPVVYRDPGFLRPIVYHSVGLLGATVAAPFRVAEMFCPLRAPACPPKQWCAPAPRPLNCGYQPPVNPLFAPKCPVPITQPAPPPCRLFACAPPGPSVAPLPSCAAPQLCGPNLPPSLVEEYQFPQWEAQDLFSGIWNLPGRLIRSGRFAGDIHGTSPCAPPACR
jgi:hypothetical protein